MSPVPTANYILGLYLLGSLIPRVTAQTPKVLREKSNLTGKLLYDPKNAANQQTCQPNQSDPGSKTSVDNIHSFFAAVSGHTMACGGKPIGQYSTSQLVSVPWDGEWDKDQLCGREVRIWDGQGNQVTNPDGPFIAWDGCLNNCGGIVEIAATVFVGLTNDQTCAYSNPQGLRIQVLDNKIW